MGLEKSSRIALLEQDGFAFKDFLSTAELAPYKDWQLSYEQRAKDLAGRLSIRDIAGLMLYAAYQLIPAKGPLAAAFAGTYDGKPTKKAALRNTGPRALPPPCRLRSTFPLSHGGAAERRRGLRYGMLPGHGRPYL